MKVLVVGGGGREHALAWRLGRDASVSKVFVAPGNGGTSEVAVNVPIGATDVDALYQFAKQNAIDLVVVGPEGALAAGLGDRLRASGINCFGPGARGAKLESSKVFAKQLMRKHAIPTADFKAFERLHEALAYAEICELPVVVKADGLAAGKGVVMCKTRGDALSAVRALMEERVHGDAGARILIEETLVGPEVSVFAITDGQTLAVLDSACDYKRLADGNKGPNTGGMGAFSPSGLLDETGMAEIERKILLPTLHALKCEDVPFCGVLYVGLMLTPVGPKVLEYNVRFGDPETQVLLPRLEGDLAQILLAAAQGRLADAELSWSSKAAVTVVLASGGYPGSVKKGVPIGGLDVASDLPDVTIFHAGTARGRGDTLVTAGGRVLAVTALGDSPSHARLRAYEAAAHIDFAGKQQRSDIALPDAEG